MVFNLDASYILKNKKTIRVSGQYYNEEKQNKTKPDEIYLTIQTNKE